MCRYFLVTAFYVLIFPAYQTTAFASECKYFICDSIAEYREDCLVTSESGKNFSANKSFLVLLADIQCENHVAIYKSGKSGWLAFGLSLFYPGLGQLYNGEYGKAFLMAGLGTIGLAVFYYGVSSTDFDGRSDNDVTGSIALTGLIVAGAVYIWSLIDAPVSANKINRNNEVNADTKSRLYVLSSLTEQSLVNLKLEIPINLY